jgi:hypothetical protein
MATAENLTEVNLSPLALPPLAIPREGKAEKRRPRTDLDRPILIREAPAAPEGGFEPPLKEVQALRPGYGKLSVVTSTTVIEFLEAEAARLNVTVGRVLQMMAAHWNRLMIESAEEEEQRDVE